MITKKNWLSVAVFGVANLFLSAEFAIHFAYFTKNLPRQLFALIFILAQMALYCNSFTDKKIVSFTLSAIFIVVLSILLYNN